MNYLPKDALDQMIERVKTGLQEAHRSNQTDNVLILAEIYERIRTKTTEEELMELIDDQQRRMFYTHDYKNSKENTPEFSLAYSTHVTARNTFHMMAKIILGEIAYEHYINHWDMGLNGVFVDAKVV